MADSLMPHFFGIETQRAGKQSLLEKTTDADPENSLHPRREQTKRDQSNQHQRPGIKHPRIHAAGESGSADEPERSDPEKVLRRMRKNEQAGVSDCACLTQ